MVIASVIFFFMDIAGLSYLNHSCFCPGVAKQSNEATSNEVTRNRVTGKNWKGQKFQNALKMRKKNSLKQLKLEAWEACLPPRYGKAFRFVFDLCNTHLYQFMYAWYRAEERARINKCCFFRSPKLSKLHAKRPKFKTKANAQDYCGSN